MPYVGIMAAAIVEGEIAYIAAATLVAHGALNPFAVLVSGAIGAAIGDQAYFYLFRGRLPRWIARFPSLEQKAMPLIGRARRHGSLMAAMIRFSPGLRIALAAACAWVGVPPLRFSILNLLSAFLWATVLLVVVAWLGPAFLAKFGLGGWKGALLVGFVIFLLFKVLGRYERQAIERTK